MSPAFWYLFACGAAIWALVGVAREMLADYDVEA